MPFTAKEVIEVEGLPWTNGSTLFAGRVATHDAVVIRRMRRAGAILLGKTNLSEFCSFWDSVNRVYGTTATRTTRRGRRAGRRAARRLRSPPP